MPKRSDTQTVSLDISDLNRESRPAAAILPTLDGYEVIQQIGRGGMGVVYEGYQRSTGRRVAIKFMHEFARDGEAARRRFEREVDLAARLTHPNIVSLLDSGAHAGRYFYVMEFVEGVTLDEHVRGLRGGEVVSAVSVKMVVRLVHSVCQAVDFAHQRGVLHRDLKPGNILVDSRGQPRLLDFGLAKAIDPASGAARDMTLSQPGQLIGTLGYMSPEQARGDVAQISVRSDVYSLGAILYEALIARLPCPIDGAISDALAAISDAPPPSPSRFAPSISADLSAVVLKALSKEATRRYATAGELAADLALYLSDEPVAARPDGATTRVIRWVRRRRGIAAVVAIAAFVLLVVGVIAGIRVNAERTRAVANEQLARDKLRFAIEALNRIVFDTDRLLRPIVGTGDVRRSLVDVALGFYDRLPQDAAILGLESIAGPQYGKLSDLLYQRENLESARRYAALSLAHARTAAALDKEDHAAQRDLAMALQRTATLASEPTARSAALAEALSMLRDAATARSDDFTCVQDYAVALMRAAELSTDPAAAASSESSATESLALITSFVERHADSRDGTTALLGLWQRFCAVTRRDNSDGYAEMSRGVEAARLSASRFPADVEVLTQSLMLEARIASALTSFDSERAAAIIEHARSRPQSLLDRYPREIRLRFAAAAVYAICGNQAASRSETDAAIAWFDKSNALVSPAFELQPNDPQYRERFAQNLAAIAGAHIRSGRLESAAELYRQFLMISEPLLAERPEHAFARAYAWRVVGDSARATDPADAEQSFRRGLAELSMLAEKRPLTQRETSVRTSLEERLSNPTPLISP